VTPVPVPRSVKRAEDGRAVEIGWDDAGHTGRYPARALRLACQCAACVEEMSGRPMLDPATVPEDVRALSLRLVGAYALHITWSDGHSSGIYPWDRLLALCPCDTCAARRGAPTT
jgi:ATP-binding protein involved in chromosome partitioning